jgi:hypothetical protein
MYVNPHFAFCRKSRALEQADWQVRPAVRINARSMGGRLHISKVMTLLDRLEGPCVNHR